LRLRLFAPHPSSHYQQAAKPTVRAYPLESAEAASESCSMTALFLTGGDTCLQYSYSILCLPSALRAIKACGPPCESISKIVGLGPRISLNFTDVIQAYAIFTLLRDAAFRF
jgi:hypothetical protein